MRAWTNEEYMFLKENYIEKFNDEIADLMNNHFKGKYRNYTASSVSAAKDRYKLHSKPKFGRLYRKEVIDFILKNYKGKDNLELAELLNQKFELNTNADKISMLKANLKRRFGIDIRTGINRGCYRKGQAPANKGKKWDEYMSKEGQANSRKTWFKKGNMPLQHREVGSERINVDGYIEIKVAEPNKWDLKHRIVYREHYGKIPKDHKIIFLDGNKLNLDINNLKAVSNAEELIMNRNKLFSTDKDITNTGAIIAKVIDKGHKLKNERKES